MNKKQERTMAMLERIDSFLTKNPLTPAIPKATTLATELKLALAAMRRQGGDQQDGFGDYLGGVSVRRDLAGRIYTDIREISDVVISFDPEDFPGVAERFRIPKNLTFQGLMDTARAFLASIAPVKAELIERGFPADFDEQLQARLAEFEAATDLKNEGRQKQRTNTAALVLSDAKVRRKAHELDVIVTKALKKTDAAMAVAWKSAVRVYSAPQRTPDDTAAGATATATAPTPAAAA